MDNETPTNDAPVTVEQIKPCPFCASPGKMIHPMGIWAAEYARPGHSGGYGPDGSRIVCTSEECSGCGRAFYGPDQDAEAIGQWNTRLAALASAPAGDGDVGLLEAARDLLDAHKRLGGAAEYRADLWACLEENMERLARPHSAVAPAGDGVEEARSLIESIARPFPGDCDWEFQARACQVVAEQALAALARPRAAVGERERAAMRTIYNTAASPGRTKADMETALSIIAATASTALQFPPAKVEG